MIHSISKTFHYEGGHRLLNHDGKCSRIHGHSYKVEVALDGELVNEPGSSSDAMIVDFGGLKQWWKGIEDQLDHYTLLEQGDPAIEALDAVNEEFRIMPFRPTAENIAAWILMDLTQELGVASGHLPGRFTYAMVTVYETETSSASAEESVLTSEKVAKVLGSDILKHAGEDIDVPPEPIPAP